MAIQFNQNRMPNRMPMGPSSGPVRTKKRPGIFQSIIGVFIGLLMVLASPFVMWSAGSQDKAGDFEKAEVVEASSSADGYIVVRGTPEYATATGGEGCYVANCIHEVKSIQTLETTTELVCSNSIKESDTVRIIGRNGSEYDDETGKETPCYDVEKDTWEEVSATTTDHEVKLGSYTVEMGSNAIYLDTKETIVEIDGEFDIVSATYGAPTDRIVYTTFLMPKQLLVAGMSDGSTLTAPAKMHMVLSQYDYAGTLANLEAQDQSARFMLWLVTFFMLFVGFSLMFGPLEWAARMFGKIPALGPLVRQGSRGMITLVALGLAIAFWIVEWLLITLLQNIWLIAIVLVIIMGVFFLLGKRKEKMAGGKKK